MDIYYKLYVQISSYILLKNEPIVYLAIPYSFYFKHPHGLNSWDLVILFSELPSNLTVLMIIAFSVFTLILSAVSNLVGVFPTESFPTDIRSSGVGFATAISRLGSAASTFLLPMSMANLGVQNTMLCLTGILVIGTLVLIAWAPETKALSLSDASNVSE